jgi:hypothetical protein
MMKKTDKTKETQRRNSRKRPNERWCFVVNMCGGDSNSNCDFFSCFAEASLCFGNSRIEFLLQSEERGATIGRLDKAFNWFSSACVLSHGWNISI